MPDTLFIALTRGDRVATIDAADFDRVLECEFRNGFVWTGRICDRTWQPRRVKHTTYAETHIRGRTLILHRLIMQARSRDTIDHINHDGLDCRRENLRVVTPAQNCQNGLPTKVASSRFKGVAVHRQTGKFEAYIRHHRVKRHLGLFSSPEDAALAYNAAASQLFGSFALLNEVNA